MNSNSIETDQNVLSYRRDFERVNDTLNDVAASVDELAKSQSIDTFGASAMASDLDDMIRTATELKAAIVSRSVRPL